MTQLGTIWPQEMAQTLRPLGAVSVPVGGCSTVPAYAALSSEAGELADECEPDVDAELELDDDPQPAIASMSAAASAANTAAGR